MRVSMSVPMGRTQPHEALDALSALDDAAFWEAIAAFGYERPAEIDPDQAWFWTRSWITGEIEVDVAIAEGRTTFYASAEEFLEALERDADDAG